MPEALALLAKAIGPLEEEDFETVVTTAEEVDLLMRSRCAWNSC
jgi:hypothetical protein